MVVNQFGRTFWVLFLVSLFWVSELVPGYSAEVELTCRMGVKEVTTHGQTFRIINGMDFIASITADGRVKLDFPETKPSFNGKNETCAWLMNALMIPVSSDERKALSTTGLRLPEGNHTFYLYYINPEKARTSAELFSDWWEIIMNPDTYQDHTAASEYVILEIRDTNPERSCEVRLPDDIRGATWYPQYQETQCDLALPQGKVFGITKRVAGIPAERIVEQGQYIQAVYEDVNNNHVPYNRTWTTLRAYPKGRVDAEFSDVLEPGQSITFDAEAVNATPNSIISIHKGYSTGLPAGVDLACSIPGNGVFRFEITNNSGAVQSLEGGHLYASYFGSVDEEAERIYLGWARRGSVTAAEICENGVPFDAVEEIYRKIYEIQVERDNVSSPNDTDLVSDYFANLYGYGNELNTFASFDEKRELMSSVENARKIGPDSSESRYFTEAAFEYRHRLVGGYLDGISRLLEGKRLYGHIANLERQYIAMPDRRVATFGWTAFEGIGSLVERHGVWQRLPFENGDLIRVARCEGSFEQLKFETFISLLIGDYYLSWNDNAPYGTDMHNFGLAHIGGAADWKNKWQPTGGEIEQYDPDNPAHPQSVGDGPGWSDGAAPGHNGGFAGAWLLSRIRNRIDVSLRYPVFHYTVGGQEFSGYFDGDEPVKGANGSSEVSRLGFGNPGQFNIINQQEHRKPIVFWGEGTGGCCAVVMNPFAGLNETTQYRIFETGEHTVSHVGPFLGVYFIDPQTSVAL